jgi:hypothetical protein
MERTGAEPTMNSTRSTLQKLTSSSELTSAVASWLPRGGSRPEVAVEDRPDGLRVRLTYLGVETGVMFARDARVIEPSVHATLDRVFEVLSWRVTIPPG